MPVLDLAYPKQSGARPARTRTSTARARWVGWFVLAFVAACTDPNSPESAQRESTESSRSAPSAVSEVAPPSQLALRSAEVPSKSTSGSPTRGVAYELPSWLKASFLDFQEDVEEARQQRKHVLVLLHLDHCPACARIVDDFADAEARAYLEEHFEVIAVNVRGDREVVWLDGETYTEGALAEALNVHTTPTLVFAGLGGTAVLQLTGYRDPSAVRQACEFVRTRAYEGETFEEFVRRLRPDESDVDCMSEPLPILATAATHPNGETL